VARVEAAAESNTTPAALTCPARCVRHTGAAGVSRRRQAPTVCHQQLEQVAAWLLR
jgi:hypothetical protein